MQNNRQTHVQSDVTAVNIAQIDHPCLDIILLCSISAAAIGVVDSD